MSDSSQEKQEVSVRVPEFATRGEIETGKQGVELFKSALKRTPLIARPELIYGDEASFIHALFLGLKAMTHYKGGIALPENMRLYGDHLVNLPAAEKVLTENPEIYFGYTPTHETAGHYMERLLDWAGQYTGPEVDLNVGLLFGDPKDAVFDYVNFNQARSTILKEAMREYRSPVKEFLDKEHQEVLRVLGWLDRNGKLAHDEKAANNRYAFISHNEKLVRGFLENHFKVTGDTQDYIVGSFRPARARGFAYSVGRVSKETLDHAKKVDEVFEFSGMNQFLKTAKRFGMFMR